MDPTLQPRDAGLAQRFRDLILSGLQLSPQWKQGDGGGLSAMGFSEPRIKL